MSRRDFDDETLMAFADGELDAETTAAIEEAMSSDDALIGRVAAFMESRVQASAALKPLIDEPVPEALTQSVQKMIDEVRKREDATAETSQPPAADNVVTFQPKTVPRKAGSSWTLPLAASLAAVIVGAGGYLAGKAGAPVSGGMVAAISDPVVAKALATTPSGADINAGGTTIKFVSSFRDEAGALCREFELHRVSETSLVSVACRVGQNWDLRLAVAAPTAGQDYVPAGASETVDAYLTTIHAGAPLSEAEEKKALGLP
ncbi:anti-sigma factor [Aminobacter anthyllidis]|uniref:anti-sigma factor family protein n=1 Tax=Aminobacter anthyllidis TaxID=1035067 RepID=UPI0024564F83|nr:anti-sigma factor [Aminobacter anthyllidis]MDH4984388.1 anti-sigma factor [Aminobacter anthyllidis]